MPFLHNFPYSLEKIRAGREFWIMTVLNNGCIHEGRPQLGTLFCSFSLLSEVSVIIPGLAQHELVVGNDD